MNSIDKDKTAKKQLMDRLFNVLQGQGMYIREDASLTPEDKLQQMDIILDTMKFLKDYDENVKVLNEHWVSKHRKDKFRKPEEDIER